MKFTCEHCQKVYNDFDCTHVCPHERFAVSESALKMLVEDGTMCARCERHVEECTCGDRHLRG